MYPVFFDLYTFVDFMACLVMLLRILPSGMAGLPDLGRGMSTNQRVCFPPSRCRNIETCSLRLFQL